MEPTFPKIYTRTPDQRRKMAVAIHEAGHAVAALDCEMTVKSATILPIEESAGCVITSVPRWFLRGKITPRSRYFAENRILVALVAGFAERKFKGRHSHIGASQDYEDAYSLAEVVCTSEGESDALVQWLMIRACNFVEDPEQWFKIQVAAHYLCLEITATGERIKEVVDAAAARYMEMYPPEPVLSCVMSREAKQSRPDFTCQICPCPYAPSEEPAVEIAQDPAEIEAKHSLAIREILRTFYILNRDEEKQPSVETGTGSRSG